SFSVSQSSPSAGELPRGGTPLGVSDRSSSFTDSSSPSARLPKFSLHTSRNTLFAHSRLPQTRSLPRRARARRHRPPLAHDSLLPHPHRALRRLHRQVPPLQERPQRPRRSQHSLAEALR